MDGVSSPAKRRVVTIAVAKAAAPTPMAQALRVERRLGTNAITLPDPTPEL